MDICRRHTCELDLARSRRERVCSASTRSAGRTLRRSGMLHDTVDKRKGYLRRRISLYCYLFSVRKLALHPLTTKNRYKQSASSCILFLFLLRVFPFSNEKTSSEYFKKLNSGIKNPRSRGGRAEAELKLDIFQLGSPTTQLSKLSHCQQTTPVTRTSFRIPSLSASTSSVAD